MYEANLLEAFGSYKIRPAKRIRSAMTSEGELVISCWYAGFKRVQADIMRYEEDLSGQTSESNTSLRTHLAEALSNECEVRAIIAIATDPKKKDAASVAPVRTTYYARKDLVGRVCSFDGERFIVEFLRTETPAQGSVSKSTRSQRRAGIAAR